MTRRFRFKAFDKATGRVYPGPYFALFGETTCFDLISKWVMEEPLGKLSLERMNDVEVFQSTGLFDKHGREIFEQDIVQDLYGCFGCKSGWGDRDDNFPHLRIVVWDAKHAKFDWQFIEEEIKDRGCSGRYLHPGNASTYEVIGTTYQNPELLK